MNTTAGSTIILTDEQYRAVRKLQTEEYMREFEAVAQVLDVPDDSFVCLAVGTASAPRDGLRVRFIK